MPAPTTPRTPWTQPPLFEPPWLVIEFRLNVDSRTDQVWGGLKVLDGDTQDVLAITAQPLREGLTGVRDALSQMLQLAADHLQSGGPFPAHPPRSPGD